MKFVPIVDNDHELHNGSLEKPRSIILRIQYSDTEHSQKTCKYVRIYLRMCML